MGAVGQSLEDCLNLTSAWSPFQLTAGHDKHYPCHAMTELEGILLREKQKHKEQVSFWEDGVN